MLEKLSSIQSALGSHRTTDSAAPEPSPDTAAEPHTAANQFSEDRAYGRLRQGLRDMQSHIEERLRPMAQLVIELEVARLREPGDDDRATLNTSLAQIDHCVLNCVDRIDEYPKGTPL